MCELCHGINSHDCPICGDHHREIECPECGGECWVYEAFDVISRRSIRVSAEEYEKLLDTELEALQQSRNLCKGDMHRCPRCDGYGYVIPDPDDYFDELAAEEKYREKYG
jgi:hypothetical protein